MGNTREGSSPFARTTALFVNVVQTYLHLCDNHFLRVKEALDSCLGGVMRGRFCREDVRVARPRHANEAVKPVIERFLNHR